MSRPRKEPGEDGAAFDLRMKDWEAVSTYRSTAGRKLRDAGFAHILPGNVDAPVELHRRYAYVTFKMMIKVGEAGLEPDLFDDLLDV